MFIFFRKGWFQPLLAQDQGLMKRVSLETTENPANIGAEVLEFHRRKKDRGPGEPRSESVGQLFA